MIAGIALLQSCSALPATSSSKEMYSWQCNKEPESLLCKHHTLIQKMLAEKDKDAKKTVQDEIRSLVKSKLGKGGSSLSEQYSAMKLSFCATNPPGAKTLCSTAASAYKTGGAASRRSWSRSRSSLSPSSSSYGDVATWYCAKPGKEEEAMCKRAALLKELRQPGLSTEARKEQLAKLKTAPMVYAQTQAIYADYCKVAEHAEKPTCTRLKHTHATRGMREWYCAQPGKATESNWCKRQDLLDKLQKISASSTDPAQKEERAKLSKEFAGFSKRPEGGGPAPSSLIAKEISEAKKAYCAAEAHKGVVICKSPMSPLGFPRSPPGRA